MKNSIKVTRHNRTGLIAKLVETKRLLTKGSLHIKEGICPAKAVEILALDLKDIYKLTCEKIIELLNAVLYTQYELASIKSKGEWRFERSSGYAGLRCQKCHTWVYEEQVKNCSCGNV